MAAFCAKWLKMPDAVLEPTQLDCVYAAGFYDGEGWVTVTHRVRRERHYYTAVAGLSNSDRQVLEWHRERWGGWVMGPLPKRNPEKERDSFRWSVSHGKALAYLLDIYPWAQIKRYRMDNSIALLRFMAARGPHRYTDAESAQLAAFYQEHVDFGLAKEHQRKGRRRAA